MRGGWSLMRVRKIVLQTWNEHFRSTAFKYGSYFAFLFLFPLIAQLQEFHIHNPLQIILFHILILIFFIGENKISSNQEHSCFNDFHANMLLFGVSSVSHCKAHKHLSCSVFSYNVWVDNTTIFSTFLISDDLLL